jgi:DNA-binding CsgD family transcriptional regulator
MVNSNKNDRSNKDLIKALLRQRAIERSISLVWNAYSLIIIYSVLIIIILCELLNINNIVIAAVAILGLTSLVIVARIQSIVVKKRLLKEEKDDFGEFVDVENVVDAKLTSSAKIQTILSEKELEVLSHLVIGKSNKKIADAMSTSVQTTKNHITHIFQKLGVFDRTSLAVLALNKGWIDFPPKYLPEDKNK